VKRRNRAVAGEQLLVYKTASVLLQYPDDRVYGWLDDVAAALDQVPDAAQREPLARLTAWLGQQHPTAAAQHYVDTFDLKRRCSPYLTYYRYGDTRQRGMALLAFKHSYRAAGLQPAGTELPDYLPAVLEFAAATADGAGRALLVGHRAGLELLRLGLQDADSPYAWALESVCAALPALSERQATDVRRLLADGPPTEDVGLDPIGSQPFAPPEFLTGTGNTSAAEAGVAR
jgi:nitrate reductase delta subunit